MRSAFLRPFLTGAALVVSLVAASADEITLAAGAGYRRPVAELAAAYEKQSGDKVLQVYGHMGQVLAQARESAKVAMVCGDRTVLDKAGGMAFTRMVRLGTGRLVVAVRKGLELGKAEDIAAPQFRRIGIPDQANAVYGKAGRQFLQRSKLEAEIDPRLIAVATVPQVTSYIASGEIDAGFINATDALGAGDRIGGFVEVGAGLYDAPEFVCGIPAAADGKAPAGAAATAGFIAFLDTAPAREILTRHGL
ncbi:molybdate ABC transporter substrate-binding protein [Rhodopseudomonas palustris]|uniref:molybdate ABC transporter substrate-binding protein n=1 Tax=Rhodopseudomonas palustris TaxID=1076 RepID=UPI002ACF0091|nr:molybdate ABC transporter substrate-binding protein [Rhodopseudomonas palustris]WQG97588.1 molybdate ABC transporter substrate-binding protein [Rhodopseudomonas palustris]